MFIQVCLKINATRGRDILREHGKYSRTFVPQMRIFAFIPSENTKEREAFKLAGFEDRGLVMYMEEDLGEDLEKEGVLMYELDWKKLNTMEHQKGDEVFRGLRQLR